MGVFTRKSQIIASQNDDYDLVFDIAIKGFESETI